MAIIRSFAVIPVSNVDPPKLDFSYAEWNRRAEKP
jgi:hypothetical protein